MHKITLLVFLMLFTCFGVLAQKDKEPPLSDFRGTWLLDEEESFRTAEEREYFEDFKLVISQAEPEIKIIQSYIFRGRATDRTIRLFTDRRGEENTYFVERDTRIRSDDDSFVLEDVKVNSKTHAKNGKLVREGSYKPDFTFYTSRLKETYELSKDGKTLTITTEKNVLATASSTQSPFEREPNSGFKPPSSTTYRLVFHKQ